MDIATLSDSGRWFKAHTYIEHGDVAAERFFCICRRQLRSRTNRKALLESDDELSFKSMLHTHTYPLIKRPPIWYYVYIYIYIWIWRFPHMGISPNRLRYWILVLKPVVTWGSILRTSHGQPPWVLGHWTLWALLTWTQSPGLRSVGDFHIVRMVETWGFH